MSRSSTNSSINPTPRDLQLLHQAARKIASLNAAFVGASPVQEGDVTSSNPPILATELFGPALQEAKGFLFVVNSQGRIVCVTDNITEYLGYQPVEWPDRSIYDFLHVANHASFGQNLLSIAGDGKGPGVAPNKPLYPFLCRMMRHCHTSGDKKRDEETLVHMQISSLPYRIEKLSMQSGLSSGSQMYLICIAQKVEDPLALYSRPSNRPTRRVSQQLMSPTTAATPSSRAEFTTQTSLEWVIQFCDLSGVSFVTDSPNNFIGSKFMQFVHSNDASLFQKYIDTVLKGSPAAEPCSSNIYRFKLTTTRYVFLQTKSWLRQASTTGVDGADQLILSRHSIVRECDSSELKGSASTSLMKAVIQSNSLTPGIQLNSNQTPSQGQLATAQTGNSYMSSSPNYYNPLVQQQESVSGGGGRRLSTVGPMSSASVQHSNASNNMSLMTGLPQLQDMNFNDVYSGSRLGVSRTGSLDVYENGIGNWNGGGLGGPMQSMSSAHQAQGHTTLTQIRGHNSGRSNRKDIGSVQLAVAANSMRDTKPGFPSSFSSAPYQGGLSQMDTTTLTHSGSSGKLRELLSSVGGSSDSATTDLLNLSPTEQKSSPSQPAADQVLRKLLQARDDEEFMSYSTAYSATHQSSTISSSAPCSTRVDTSTGVTSPALSSTSFTKASDHHLLKKLLSDESQAEDGLKPERAVGTGLLQKLLKDGDEKEASSMRKSPPSQSPTGSARAANRRHSSGSSIKDGKFQATRWEDIGRGTKRKISNSTSGSVTSSSAAEPDSTASANNTNLLNQLLTKPISTTAKTDLRNITATPLEKLKAERGKSNHDVVDVVNDRIMLGTEQIDIERFTSMTRSSDSASAAAASVYQKQSSNYTHSAMYGSGNQRDLRQQQLLSSADTGPTQGDSFRTGYTTSNTKDYYGLSDFCHQQLLGQQDSLPPVNLQQHTKSEGPAGMAMSGGSMLEQLLNPDCDNLIIQELESLLGGADSEMQVTSAEDELAIKDIEKQLLYSIENLPNSGHYGTGAEPHSPGFNMGLTSIPASASNPVCSTAMFNICHKPQISNISNALGSSYGSGQTTSSNPQHVQRQQHQQGPPIPRAMTMAAIRAGHRAANRQTSGPGRPMTLSGEGKIRRRSGNSPAGSLSSYSPISNGPGNPPMQGNFTLPSNFGEMMKSSNPPPNVKLSPPDLNSNSFPNRAPTAEMMHHEMTSPRGSRTQNFPPSPMDIAVSPQHFRFEQYPGSRSALQRQLMGSGINQQQYHPGQVNMQHPTSQQQMLGAASGLLSPAQELRAGSNPSSHMDTTGPTLPPAQSALQQFSQVDQWILNQRVTNNAVSSSQYVRQEMKAKITARAQKQNTSPQHPNFVSNQHSMASQQHMSITMMSPPPSASPAAPQRHLKVGPDIFTPFSVANPMQTDLTDDMGYGDSVLPDDILNQITELTDTQNEIQHQHQMDAMKGHGSFPTDNSLMTNDHDIAMQKISQSKRETSEVRQQLRALAGPDGHKIDTLFTNLLGQPPASKSNSMANYATDSGEFQKLKMGSQNPVSVISVEPRAPIEKLQPNDQTNSLLQQLLTDNSAVS